MIPFLKKILSFKNWNNASEQIEELQIKKQMLEDQLNTLQDIEEELIRIKKIADEPLKSIHHGK